MNPYYQDDFVTLYHGEADEVLRFVNPSIDHVITDPPYSSGAATSGQKSADPKTKYCQGGRDLGRPSFGGDAKDQRSFTAWQSIWLSRARSLMGPSGYCLIFTDWRQLPSTTDALQAADFVWRGVIAWDKGRHARAPHKGYIRHQCEYVVWGTNGPCVKRLDDGPFDGCYHQPIKQADKHHMVGKPTPLMTELVRVAAAGEVILDPFAGSGTTLVAAKQMGRRAIGIERELAYCEIATNRLKAM
jgi:site-specific DNA-methyltransferase (adenine-specific)